MKPCTYLSALLAALILPCLSLAEGPPSQPEEELGWDQFDDPSFDPTVRIATREVEKSVVAEEVVAAEPSDAEILESVAGHPNGGPKIQLDDPQAGFLASTDGVVLGPRGFDDLGRAGRLHTVARGDTLWDLAAAYLGTPWVWPSVWIDNEDIKNPDLIRPGDKIWITANEMRVVTDAEAESFLTPVAESADDESEQALSMDPTSIEDAPAPVAALEDDPLGGGGFVDEPSTLEAFPVAIVGVPATVAPSRRRVTVSRRESMGFVSAEALAGSSSIVGSPTERIFMTSGDDAILGLGEGDVEVGDQFSIFDVIEEVRDPESLRLLGYHIEPLGWLEVVELTGDTSIGEIRTSYSEIARGAKIIMRDPVPTSVEVVSTPDVAEGKIVFLPFERTLMADGGYVYLNRGEFHGMEIGSELEVFDPGVVVGDSARRIDVKTPDRVVARLIVVSVEPDSSVGFVLWSKRELAVGDAIRPTIPTLAQR